MTQMKNLENRSLTSEFEVRNEEGKPTVVEGYAARFEDETVIGGAFVEKLSGAHSTVRTWQTQSLCLTTT